MVKYRSCGTAISIATTQIRTATRIVIGRPILGFRGLMIALYLKKSKLTIKIQCSFLHHMKYIQTLVNKVITEQWLPVYKGHYFGIPRWTLYSLYKSFKARINHLSKVKRQFVNWLTSTSVFPT